MQPHDQYYTLLGTALSSNAGPDLFLMNGGAQAKARMDALVKLDDKVADIKGGTRRLARVHRSGRRPLRHPAVDPGFCRLLQQEALCRRRPRSGQAAAHLGRADQGLRRDQGEGRRALFRARQQGGVRHRILVLGDRRGRMDGRGAGGLRRGQAEMVEPAGEGGPAELGRRQRRRLVPAGRQFDRQVHGRI